MEDSRTVIAQSISSDELVDSLNEGIIGSIKSSGKSLPASAIRVSSPSPFQCEWTEFSTELCCAAVEDLRQYFPPLDGSEVGTDGRPLLYAACLGLLLSQRDRDRFFSDWKTPLSTFISISSFLLDELGVDPNQPTLTTGACLRPPLHLVSRSCHPSAVHALLSKGADPNLPDEEGWTALMACCMPDIPSCKQGGPAMEERVETVKTLLKGVTSECDAIDIDARNYCGYSALHYACEGLKSSLIKCLLEDGEADATLRTVWGQSCIGIVKSQSYINKVEAKNCETIILAHLKKTGKLEAIQSFLEEETKAINLLNIVEDVLIPASRPLDSVCGNETVAAQDERIITALMKHLELDPRSLFESGAFKQFAHGDCNLYEEIHRRIMQLLPSAYLKVYKSNPTNEEREIITCTNYSIRKTAEISIDGVRRIDSSLVMSQSFDLHRERGHIVQQQKLLTDLIAAPLQRAFAFAIPSNEILKEITVRAPKIVEMGAGTGYWSFMLSRTGADVVSFDLHPTAKDQDEEKSNVYCGSQSYFPVQEGISSTVFDGSKPEIAGRALLLVWPNNPDAEDNEHVADGSSLPPIWDLECLERYHELGGDTVIFVGEREAKIQLMPDATNTDCGFCASRKFQLYLQSHYELEAELECPRWWMKEDDVTIWKRK
mmetsp:Transcript_12985/g.27578  ORF Transcript_12985/g.27578 Transcript_12985/m.27578 type:complete len:660 (-) Transcript_12985:715-2694(-)|eukprot:CAMPEP_0183731698 /NCGR_PEP_ID=MMETSP0737-20130205/36158_1 /TAXON_ID=385413 /ORGANISM="Thalassiosira miniscula, Strain CCMP1093" /LENGTH=659 /DNA_ID=CAMNT_0025964499 /DNA_START=100 /DNA_END=2079 /DNA_ORIENTATION=-